MIWQRPLRRTLLAATAALLLSGGGACAAGAQGAAAMIKGCIMAAAAGYRLPPAVLVILLNVEGGSLGGVSPNTNGTVDIGPMQVNRIWLPDLAAHWHTSTGAAYRALRDDFAPMSRPEPGFCAKVSTKRTAISGGASATTTRTTRICGRAICARFCGRCCGCTPWTSGRTPSRGRCHPSRSGQPSWHRELTMRPQPNPRATWPSGDDNSGFNLIVILVGCCVGSYLLWTNYHAEISAAVMALHRVEIDFIRHFTHRYDLAARQMAAADPSGVTLRDLYGIARNVGMFFRIPASVLMVLLAIVCTVRAAPSRYRRAFDLDGLVREQAATFRTTAAFVGRHLRLCRSG